MGNLAAVAWRLIAVFLLSAGPMALARGFLGHPAALAAAAGFVLLGGAALVAASYEDRGAHAPWPLRFAPAVGAAYLAKAAAVVGTPLAYPVGLAMAPYVFLSRMCEPLLTPILLGGALLALFWIGDRAGRRWARPA